MSLIKKELTPSEGVSQNAGLVPVGRRPPVCGVPGSGVQEPAGCPCSRRCRSRHEGSTQSCPAASRSQSRYLSCVEIQTLKCSLG